MHSPSVSHSHIWKRWGRTVFSIVVVGVLLTPIYYVGIYGMMSTGEIFRQPPYVVPPNPTLEYYGEAFLTLIRYLQNSVIISAGAVLVTLVVAAPAGFALAKLRVRSGGLVQLLMAFVQFLPVVAVVIPLFLVFDGLGLGNTRIAVVLTVASLTIPLNVIILSAYMRSIPYSLLESAYIDGATPIQGFFLLLPLARPGIATGAMFAFLLSWGDFAVSLTLLSSRRLFPMSVGLYDFIGQYGAEWSVLMAGSMIYTIPTIFVVLFAGRYLVSGLTAGAVKD